MSKFCEEVSENYTVKHCRKKYVCVKELNNKILRIFFQIGDVSGNY